MAERKSIVWEIHRPARRNFKRRRVIVKGINDLWQADLVEMIPYANINKNYNYMLTVIDAFSKFAYAIPVKNKNMFDVSEAMHGILKKLGRSNAPKNLQTDDGKEFFNQEFKKLMSKYDINHYSTFSGLKASICERFNRTIKNSMWFQFSMQGTYKWIDIIKGLVDKYNNTVHRTIRMKPVSVNKRNEKSLLKTVYSNIKVFHKPKFKVGDYVRVSKHRLIFDKSYTPNWTTEIFKIFKIRITNPITYLLEDYLKNKIKGGFYEYEMQKVKYPNAYLVDKVIKKRGNQSRVSWLGFDSSHNSWVNTKDII